MAKTAKKMSTAGRILVNEHKFDIIVRRLCQQLIENYDDFDNTCIIGIQERGAILSEQLVAMIESVTGISVDHGKLDISFHRDDYRMRDKPIAPRQTLMDFTVEAKKVIIVDDVLYTGRTIHSAISALQHYGRPERVELLVFVDRRFNRHLPIRADYSGVTVDAIDEAYVRVLWQHLEGTNQIKIFSKKVKV